MSKASARQINYGLRPAKNIERKMMGDLFARLSLIAPLPEYRYVGFGSTYFNDFALYHELLGINDMVSIERRGALLKRCEFNRPYKCIKLAHGESTTILPQLDWKRRSLVWLDYDSMISAEVLQDIETVVSKARSGSVLVVSVNVEPPRPPRHDEEGNPVKNPDPHAYRRNYLENAVGPNRIPNAIAGKDLADWGLAKVCHLVMSDQVKETLFDCNGAIDDAEQRRADQVLHFHYSDNARMLTVGWLLINSADRAKLGAHAFDSLPFVRTDDKALLIDPPQLTGREVRHLNRLLPTSDEDIPEVDWLPASERKRYMAVYRYFPVFAESEL
ncbi:MAG TPA: O-methyltransferase [Phycisphaerales bacterium]|nr:O-methyltransferase [Phycisphaerales bacterium]